MSEPIRVIGASGFGGLADGLDQLSAAAGAPNPRVDVEVLQVTRGRGRPGIFMEQKVDDSDELIGGVSGAQTVNSPVVKSLPGGLRDRRGDLHGVKALILGP